MHKLPLRTRSLLLRHFVPEEAETVRALNAEPSTRTWLPSHVYRTPDEAADRVGYLIDQYAYPANPRLSPYVLGVEHLRTGQLLGHVGFSALGGEVEISYPISQASRGHGLGAEAIGAACAWLMQACDLSQIVAITAQVNTASRRTLSRAGFAHIADELGRFQGRQQSVSTYVLRQTGP